METILHRGPRAFADQMLILQWWTSLMNLAMLNFIPFWIQICGIPLQFMNQEVIAHIGRAMAMLMDVDYNEEAASRVEYVRVHLNWDVNEPLQFQRTSNSLRVSTHCSDSVTSVLEDSVKFVACSRMILGID